MLKKIAILTAAAGMLSTSMAVLAEGPTVYGRITFGFQSISGETDAVDSQRIDDKLGSRLGVSGSNDLGNGTSVDYLLEYGANAGEKKDRLSLRHANMTLNGSFGQFRLGQQTGVLYRYIGSNSDQSTGASYGGNEWYAIAGKTDTKKGVYRMNSDHGLRMRNIAAYRFGAGPGGDDPFTFDIQIQGKEMSKAGTAARTENYWGVDEFGNSLPVMTAAVADDTDTADVNETITAAEAEALTDASQMRRERPVSAVAAMDDDKTIDSITIGAATSLGPVKFQLAYVDENGSDATGDRSPNLLSLGFRVPVGSAEIRGHMTEVDPDVSMRDDNEAWGLLLMNDFGGGYFGMIGVGNYTDGGKGMAGTSEVMGGMYATTIADGTTEGVTAEMIRFREVKTTDTDTRYARYDNGQTVTVATDNDSAGDAVNQVNSEDIEEKKYKAATKGVHKDAGDMTNLYVSLTKSFGGGLSAVAEYSTVSTTVTEMDGVGDDKETTNEFHLSLIQTF